MITLRLILKKYDWAVTILYECDCSDISEIEDHLKSIDCSLNLKNIVKDFTYNTLELHRTIITIKKYNTKKETITAIDFLILLFITTLNLYLNIQDKDTLALLIEVFKENTHSIVRELSYQ